MKAISLWQPYASLIAAGLKHYETRSWGPPAWAIGQQLAIHATLRRQLDDIPASIERLIAGLDLPCGAIVCTARLLGAYQVAEYRGAARTVWVASHVRGSRPLAAPASNTVFPSIFLPGDQRDMGNYAPGRWLWWLSEIRPLKPPFPCRGYQKLWDWDEQAAMEAAL